MEEAKIPPPFDECPTPHPLLNHEYFSLEFQGGSKAYLSKSCEGSGAKSSSHYDYYGDSHCW